MRQLCVCQQFNQNFLKSTPATLKRMPGPLAAFLRLFPLLVGLHRRRYLLRAKDSLDPCIIGGDLPQFLVFHIWTIFASRGVPFSPSRTWRSPVSRPPAKFPPGRRRNPPPTAPCSSPLGPVLSAAAPVPPPGSAFQP